MRVDSGGWVRLVDARDYYEDCGHEDDYNKHMRARKYGTRYAAVLTPSRQRTWRVTELQIVIIALKSDNVRFRIMVQANPIAGGKTAILDERITGARSNQRIRCVLIQMVNLKNSTTLNLAGSVTHKSNDVAAKDIL
jgi:hypothetical protein